MKINVLPEERRHEILNILAKEGKLTVPELSRVLNVSVDTVRRDLKELEQAGHLARVHGGALPKSPSTPPYSARKAQNKSAREEVARETAKLIQHGQIVLFDSGTTALEISRYLSPDLTATVITVSPSVVMALSTHTNIKIIMLPGTLDKSSMSVTGSTTLEALRRIRADICISGVCSIHPEIGVTTTSYEEAEIKRQMIYNASEVIVAATADKLGTAVPFEVSGIGNINQLVTESTIALETLIPYQQAGINVIRAKKT
jgi:DeoR/GlpR family transcriptional regulator of sugar metabolism